jgi:hypothetical protein
VTSLENQQDYFCIFGFLKTETMDIQALKIDLVQKILKSNRPSVLKKIDQIFISEETDDWWNELPPEIQESINMGLEEMESDHLLTNEQVVQETRAKYGF